MGLLLWVASGTFGLIIVLSLIGLTIPRNHRVARSLSLRQPPDVVWKLISDFANQTSWRTGLRSVKQLPNLHGREVWEETLRRSQPIRFETTRDVTESLLIRTIQNEDLPFGGSWTYELKATAEGTKLIITEQGFVKSPIFRLIAKLFMSTSSTIDGYLKDVANHFHELPMLQDE